MRYVKPQLSLSSAQRDSTLFCYLLMTVPFHKHIPRKLHLSLDSKLTSKSNCRSRPRTSGRLISVTNILSLNYLFKPTKSKSDPVKWGIALGEGEATRSDIKNKRWGERGTLRADVTN